MSTVEITLAAPRAEVWDALVDVRTYPTWLIGARRIRAVDDGWPGPGTAFHHVVGLGGPLTIADRTTSVAVVPHQHLELEVRARPLIQATVTFDLSDAGDGTHVVMEEHPIGVHRLASPLLAPLTQARNRASLERLEERVQARSVGG
jgi:uncharacterized protein YndB with AHSA1/START domain